MFCTDLNCRSTTEILLSLDCREAAAVVKECASPERLLSTAYEVMSTDPAECRRRLELGVRMAESIITRVGVVSPSEIYVHPPHCNEVLTRIASERNWKGCRRWRCAEERAEGKECNWQCTVRA
eukprot:SAG31_NODE_15_length_37942_cov_32.078297_9_plen_124_part_00